MIGQVIGTYKILEKIGEGGMGVVFKGVDTGLERPVAIKVLTPEFANNPELIARFRSEGKAQANLNHTNITTLYAFLQSEGQVSIVMEYIEGETFESLLMRGKLPWKDAASMTRQALHGLGYAHGMGVIHRDIKPSNLMLTKTGTVKIMDFGIAKMLGGSTKTRTGLQMGTPQYMSPEQIRGRQVDARSDIYSLGITLYQMLSGDLPFQADSDYELMSAHINTPPPVLTDIHKDVPDGMEQCVRKALAKEPENRFQNAEEFETALDSAAKSPSGLPETKIEYMPKPGFPVQQDALARKTVIDTATPVRPRTIIETQVPRIPTPAPVITPAPAPVAQKKSALIPILIAAFVGAAIAGGAWWKIAESPVKQAEIVDPQKNQNTLGKNTPNNPNGVTPQPEKPVVLPPGPKTTNPPVIAKPIEKPRTAPPVNQPQANLIVLCNMDCTWTLDGQPQGSLAAGRPTSIKVPVGEHMVTASSPDGADSFDTTVNAASPAQNVPARMDLLTKRNQRLQAEAVERQRSAQAQAQQAAIERQQQIQQQQQAAQAQRGQQQQMPNAQALSAAITSPCQIPALPQIWRNVANNGRYRIRIDCEHADIYEAQNNRIVADLAIKKNKYSGSTLLSPCGAQGKMEILSINPGRIDARVEIPNAYNHQCTKGLFLAIPNWTQASFIPE
jgi:serine/threonine protein kinase